jgi:hypothetical protein
LQGQRRIFADLADLGSKGAISDFLNFSRGALQRINSVCATLESRQSENMCGLLERPGRSSFWAAALPAVHFFAYTFH